MGQSVDFSFSGMSFKTQYQLDLGTRVEISLSLPDVDNSIMIPLEIVRNVPEGKLITYGARFTTLASSTRELLEKFVLQN